MLAHVTPGLSREMLSPETGNRNGAASHCETPNSESLISFCAAARGVRAGANRVSVRRPMARKIAACLPAWPVPVLWPCGHLRSARWRWVRRRSALVASTPPVACSPASGSLEARVDSRLQRSLTVHWPLAREWLHKLCFVAYSEREYGFASFSSCFLVLNNALVRILVSTKRYSSLDRIIY